MAPISRTASRPVGPARCGRSVRRVTPGMLVLALVSILGLAASSAQASPETLRRSVGNLVQAPIDAVLSPVTAGRTLVRNLRDVDDTMPVKIFYAGPGYIWLTGVQFGAAILRGVAGALELVPGIFLLPFETDISPLYDPADRGAALVEMENPLADNDVMRWVPIVTWNVRFGVTYTSAEY